MERDAGSNGIIGKALHRVSRYSEILRVLVRYGFAGLVRKLDARIYRRLGLSKKEAWRSRRLWSRPERMRRAFEELGPTFVKLGQLLSHRPDLLPPDWIREFEKLRSQVPPVSIEEIRTIFLEDFGRSPEEFFDDFNPDPVAAASIAQVYRARLKTSHTDGITDEIIDVAVKVQRPGIHRIIEMDLAILKDIARIMERRGSFSRIFAPLNAFWELERVLRSELDFRNEAKNLARFAEFFNDNPQICAPEPVNQYSSKRVLVMTWIDGVPVGDSAALDSIKSNRQQLARLGADAVLRQIFEHRFFHADPHGHNILIMTGNVIAFLDFGQMGSILPGQRVFLADLLSALIRMDAPRAVRAILRWSGYCGSDQMRQFVIDMDVLIDRHLGHTFGTLDFSEMVNGLTVLIRRYGIEVPSNFYLLAKAMSAIEDIASSLDPDFDFISAAEPFVKRMIRSELDSKQIINGVSGAAEDAAHLLKDLPGEASDLLSLIKAGKLRMEFNLKQLDEINNTVKRVVTRLTASILLAAMIMGSSILVQSLIPPLFFGVPVIGILGFMFSGLIALVLLFDLWKHR